MTSRGRAVAVLATLLIPSWRLLGVQELLHLAVGLITLELGAVLWVWRGRSHLKVSRELSRQRVPRGDEVEIIYKITNDDAVPSPPIEINERVSGATAPLAVSLPSLGPGVSRQVGATFRPTKRGLYRLEGAEAVVSDPFGLAAKVHRFREPLSLLVTPRVEPLHLPDKAKVEEPRTRARYAAPSTGGDFYGVRSYVPGDDPRRIHWRTSARRGTLMVREDDSPRRERVTVVLDDRFASHSRLESFEWCIDAAASVCSAYLADGSSVALRRAAVGATLAHGRGPGHHAKVLESLTVATEDRLTRHLSRIPPNPGVVVIIAGELAPLEAVQIVRGCRQAEELIVVFPPGDAVAYAAAAFQRSSSTVVAPLAEEGLADAWARAIKQRRWEEISVHT